MWAPDEPRYAEVAREIVERGDFLVMHLCGEVYPDKPPLLYWIAGLAGALSGWSELAMRLVSIASACATAWLCAVLARRWWGREEARLAPALFLGTVMVTDIGGRLQIDPLLALLCTWALVEVDASLGSGGGERMHAVRAGLACGLAALAKGPVAFVVVGLVTLGWMWLGRRAPRSRPSRWAVALALIPTLVPVAGWALLATWREPELGRQLFYGQHLGRTVEGTQHAGPIWKHLVRMPLLLLPWTVPVVLGVIEAARSLRRRGTSAQPDTGLQRAALWLVVLFMFFSVIPPKRDLYLLPAYPGAALVATRWLVSAWSAGRFPRWVGWFGTAVLAAAAVLLLAARAIVQSDADFLGGLDPGALAWRALPAGVVFLVGAFVSARLLRKRASASWARAISSTWALGASVAIGLVYPFVDPVKSPQGVSEWVAARSEKPERIPCVGLQPEGYRFYSGIPAVRDDDLLAALQREGDDFLALICEGDHRELPDDVRSRFRVLHRARVGSRNVLVLGATRPGELDVEPRTSER